MKTSTIYQRNVMARYDDGAAVEKSSKNCSPQIWSIDFDPEWNQAAYDYRIKEEPKTKTLYYCESPDTREVSVFTALSHSPAGWNVIKTEEIELTPKQEGE